MKIGQTYYTSAREGLSGRAGFQTHAATPGLSPVLLARLERIGSYTPPSSLPTAPAPETIAGMPVSLIFERMADGEAALGQSRYTGQDYSGRFGNYFAHFLILSPADIAQLDFPPVALWRSPLWTTRESPTTELPFVERLEKAGGLTSAFLDPLRTDGSMLRHLGDMLSALERAMAGGPRLILAATDDTIACWIALLTQLLPLPLAWNVSFTTYTRQPAYAGQLICGTTLDSDFSFSEFEIEHQYAVFDFLKQRFSPVELSPFAGVVMKAFSSSSCDPFRFPGFLRRVAPACPREDLAAAFAAFALTHNVETGAPFAELCAWCTPRAATFSPAEFSNLLAALREEAAASPAQLQSFAELLHAGMEAGIATQGITVFVDLLLQALPTADLAWLRKVPALLRGGQVRLPAGHPAVAVESLREPARLLAVLPLLDLLGALEGQTAALLSAGRTVLGVRLDDPAVAQALPTLVQTAYGRHLLEGVAEVLEDRAGTPAHLAPLAALLRDPAVAGELERIARQRGFAGLFCWIEADRLRRSNVSPDQMFIRLVQLQNGLTRQAKGATADRAFAFVWPDGIVGDHFRTVLIGAYEEESSRKVLEGSRVLSALALELAARRGAVRQADIDHARRLLQFPEALGAKEKASLEAMLLLLRSLPVETRGEEIARLWALLPKVDQDTGRKLLALAPRVLFELESAGHKTHLQRGLRDYGAAFATLYAEELQRRCEMETPEFFLRHARRWMALNERGVFADGEAITLAIARLYRSKDKQGRAAIDEAFVTNPELQARWQEMVAGRSFLEKTFERTLSLFRRKR